jgi:hypothetical protein
MEIEEVDALRLQVDSLLNKVYTYGVIDNGPYLELINTTLSRYKEYILQLQKVFQDIGIITRLDNCTLTQGYTVSQEPLAAMYLLTPVLVMLSGVNRCLTVYRGGIPNTYILCPSRGGTSTVTGTSELISTIKRLLIIMDYCWQCHYCSSNGVYCGLGNVMTRDCISFKPSCIDT